MCWKFSYCICYSGKYSCDEGEEGKRFLQGGFSLYSSYCMLLIMMLSFLLKWVNQVRDSLQQCETGKIIEVEKSLRLNVTCLISLACQKTGTFLSPSWQILIQLWSAEEREFVFPISCLQLLADLIISYCNKINCFLMEHFISVKE